MRYPRSFSHIGLSVPDIEKAVTFYSEVMGWYTIKEPGEIKEAEANSRLIEVFGKDWERVSIAHMTTSDGIGIELFQFANHEERSNQFEYWKTGIFHYAVQDPDIEGLVEKIKAYGGKQTMPIRELMLGERPYRMVYCEDPFGNAVEIYTHSYELIYGKDAYKK